MIGVEIIKPDGSIDSDTRDRIMVEGFKEGIVLLPCGDSAIRFSPPLVITKEEVDTGLDRFREALKKVFAGVLRGSHDTTDVVKGFAPELFNLLV